MDKKLGKVSISLCFYIVQTKEFASGSFEEHNKSMLLTYMIPSNKAVQSPRETRTVGIKTSHNSQKLEAA